MKYRTYRRRKIVRKSGFTVSGKTTGGEAKLIIGRRFRKNTRHVTLEFFRKRIEVPELFKKKIGALAFGGYIYSENKLNIDFSFEINGERITEIFGVTKQIITNDWNKIGCHLFIPTDRRTIILMNTKVAMDLFSTSDKPISVDLACFDFDAIKFKYYTEDPRLYNEFAKKTSITIPELYYLRTDVPLRTYLMSPNRDDFENGKLLVLKSCNRCARFLPINTINERHTLAFANHCVIKAPCDHSTFSKYKIILQGTKTVDNIIKNVSSDDARIVQSLEPENIVSYFGHQLECKGCKKYFVNVFFNPRRTSTQHREDSLRRRALDILANELFGSKELVYHRVRKKSGKEFDVYIWKKFNKKCFKCGEKSKELKINEVNIDHTMPLAYLYPLDETATCLCPVHNSEKHDKFPVDFYDKDEIMKLAKITGLDIKLIRSREVNVVVVERLREKVIWFFDNFLARKEYRKVRSGKCTADLIFYAIQKVTPINLIEEYFTRTKKLPSSITLPKRHVK